MSARATDAVALALHAWVGIWADTAVLSLAGEPVPGDTGGEEPAATGDALGEDELQRFRRFLDSADPEDFDPGWLAEPQRAAGRGRPGRPGVARDGRRSPLARRAR